MGAQQPLSVPEAASTGRLRQVLHACAVSGACRSCLLNFLNLMDRVSFIRIKAGMKDWYLVSSGSVFTQWGPAVKGQTRGEGKLHPQSLCR